MIGFGDNGLIGLGDNGLGFSGLLGELGLGESIDLGLGTVGDLGLAGLGAKGDLVNGDLALAELTDPGDLDQTDLVNALAGELADFGLVADLLLNAENTALELADPDLADCLSDLTLDLTESRIDGASSGKMELETLVCVADMPVDTEPEATLAGLEAALGLGGIILSVFG